MLSRLKKLTETKTRQLITACMFGGYMALATTNLIVNRNALSVIDLGLLIPGFATLGTAVAQSIVRSIHGVMNAEVDEEQEPEQKQADKTLVVRNSTHNMINSALHIGASSCFITLDGLLLAGIASLPASTPASSVAVRLAGSATWNTASWMNLFTAIARDRRQENHPDEEIRALGIRPEVYALSNEVLYMIAAICYAYAIYSESSVNPFRAAANSLWLLAGTIGTTAAIHGLIKNEDAADSDIELSAATESNSSEVVVQAPGLM